MPANGCSTVAFLLVLSLIGCSHKSESGPALSINSTKTSLTTLSAETPEQIKELWAEANPMPDWIEGTAKRLKPITPEGLQKAAENEALSQVLRKLDQIEQRMEAMKGKNPNANGLWAWPIHYEDCVKANEAKMKGE